MPDPAPRAEDVEDAGRPMRLRCRCLFIAAPQELRLDERETGAPAREKCWSASAIGGICGSDLHYFHDGGFGTVASSGR